MVEGWHYEKRELGDMYCMKHLALIMDGNRRWAAEQGMEPLLGHEKGRDAARRAIKFCIDSGIKYLSLYAFSIENFKRSKQEQKHLFDLLVNGIAGELDEFIKEGVRIRFIGDRRLFPRHLMPSVRSSEQKTRLCSNLVVNVLFCYGAQQEFVSAARKISLRVKQGKLAVEDITEDTIQKAMWTAGTPNPELIIRTGGRARLSNFLLYQAAYSELAFLDCHWPEITEAHLAQCVADFQAIQRNYGS
jgi:undecaprenyl diphosphate synthase